MPVYVYLCRECKEVIEKMRAQAARDDEVLCPKCQHRMKRSQTAAATYFHRKWIPTTKGWERGDM